MSGPQQADSAQSSLHLPPPRIPTPTPCHSRRTTPQNALTAPNDL